MPGVSVQTLTRTGPVAPNIAPSGQVFMVGLAERGQTTAPELVRGVADFQAKFGTRVSYSHLYDNIATFFEEGGAQAWVVRVVGPAATAGTVTLLDRQTVGEATIKVDAIGAGAWSDDVDLVVSDVASGTEVAVVYQGTTVERHVGATIETLVSAINTSAYVTATNQGSDASPDADKLPKAGTFNLSAGSDDRASVTATHYETALGLFDPSLGDGAVAIPGVGASVHSALLTHCRNNNRRIALLSAAETATTNDLTSAAAGLNSEFGGLFAPWVQISTPSGAAYTSPEGYVAGVRNRAHVEAGPWRAPAGQIAVARSVIGLRQDYSRAVGDTLDAAKVNAIRLIGGNTVRLYGWRSLSNDVDNFSMLSARDTLNNVVVGAEARLEQFVFQTIDGKGQLLSTISGTLTGMLEPMRTAGGLYELIDATGKQVDNGYLVDVGPSVNTFENLARNEVKARISIRVSPTASLISVTVVKVGLLSGL